MQTQTGYRNMAIILTLFFRAQAHENEAQITFFVRVF
jgi:hypothetical protein